jgi:hypothetical protein
LFTWSALTPIALYVALAGLLSTLEAALPSPTYWTLYIGGSVVIGYVAVTWRTLLAYARPRSAVDYYAATCIDRLRPARASDADRGYLRAMLPRLEHVLTMPRYTHEFAGTRTARARVADAQHELASRIGKAEMAWLADRSKKARDELVDVLGQVIVTRHFADWVRLWPGGQPEAGGAPAEPGRPSLLARIRDTFVDAGIEQLLAGVTVLVLAIVPKL